MNNTNWFKKYQGTSVNTAKDFIIFFKHWLLTMIIEIEQMPNWADYIHCVHKASIRTGPGAYNAQDWCREELKWYHAGGMFNWGTNFNGYVTKTFTVDNYLGSIALHRQSIKMKELEKELESARLEGDNDLIWELSREIETFAAAMAYGTTVLELKENEDFQEYLDKLFGYSPNPFL